MIAARPREIVYPAQPDIRPVAKRLYRLQRDYVLVLNEDRITIPRGFELDGGSIPRLAWTVLGETPDGIGRAAYLIHDWIYRHNGVLTVDGGPMLLFTRKQADALLRDQLRELGMGGKKSWLIHRAVRIGGRRW